MNKVTPSKGRNACVVCQEHCGRSTVADPPYIITVREQDGWRRMVHPDEDERTDLVWGYAHLACWDAQ